jgi:hypothetical protein
MNPRVSRRAAILAVSGKAQVLGWKPPEVQGQVEGLAVCK